MKDLFLISSVPWWLILFVALGSGALLIQQFLALRQRLTLAQSSALVGLRACVYALLIFFLFGPALVETRVTKLRRPLTILVDSSQSMNFPAGPNTDQDAQQHESRIEVVKEKLAGGKESLLQKLSRDYDLRLLRFGTSLEPIGPGAVAQLTARDHGTRLLELLQAAAQDAGERSAIILFSDGIANGYKQTLDGNPALPVPVFTVGVGDSDNFTDVRVAEVRAPHFAFRGREFKQRQPPDSSGRTDCAKQSQGI
jgi:hypothetical protein